MAHDKGHTSGLGKSHQTTSGTPHTSGSLSDSVNTNDSFTSSAASGVPASGTYGTGTPAASHGTTPSGQPWTSTPSVASPPVDDPADLSQTTTDEGDGIERDTVQTKQTVGYAGEIPDQTRTIPPVDQTPDFAEGQAASGDASTSPQTNTQPSSGSTSHHHGSHHHKGD